MDIRKLYNRLLIGLDKIYVLDLNQIYDDYSPAISEVEVDSLLIDRKNHTYSIKGKSSPHEFTKNNYFKDDKDFNKFLKYKRHAFVWTDERSIARRYLKVITELWRSHD